MSRFDPEPSADVTDAELAVLQVLWDRGSATVRQLADHLYPGGDASHYGTVQKLLQRLQRKRCVSRVARRSPIEFQARVTREALVDLRLGQIVDNLCAGSLAPLLTHLTKRRQLSTAERRELEQFLGDLGDRKRRRSRSPKTRKS